MVCLLKKIIKSKRNKESEGDKESKEIEKNLV